jgi:proline iminopeptidase
MADSLDKIVYPASKPYAEGAMTTADGEHELHYEEYGNPDGIPAVYLHGGPGASSSPSQAQYFDPKAFRIILLDQRGCGQSTPAGKLEYNTPDLLVADIEQLKNRLGIKRWHVVGGSWGSALSLLYAEKHPDSVESLSLRGIYMLRKQDNRYFYQAAEALLPQQTKNFLEFLPAAERADYEESYYKRIHNPDPAISIPAAQAWNYFEAIGGYMDPPPDSEIYDPDDEALRAARIETSFFHNHMFNPANRILNDIDKIRHIPTIIIQGRYDIVCPPAIALELKQAFTEAQLQMVKAGHYVSEPEISRALIAATNRIRDTGTPVSTPVPVSQGPAPSP